MSNGPLFNDVTPEERALLSEAVYTAIESQQDTINYARDHMEDYDPDDVEKMHTRLKALEALAKKV